jgi:hypothetical protein
MRLARHLDALLDLVVETVVEEVLARKAKAENKTPAPTGEVAGAGAVSSPLPLGGEAERADNARSALGAPTAS